jgi:hypothetical protein
MRHGSDLSCTTPPPSPDAAGPLLRRRRPSKSRHPRQEPPRSHRPLPHLHGELPALQPCPTDSPHLSGAYPADLTVRQSSSPQQPRRRAWPEHGDYAGGALPCRHGPAMGHFGHGTGSTMRAFDRKRPSGSPINFGFSFSFMISKIHINF